MRAFSSRESKPTDSEGNELCSEPQASGLVALCASFVMMTVNTRMKIMHMFM